ncbi:carbohydrate ABC transporter permease [Microlunatus elymi]|uniref:Carbohydrate ABC transporter permease n=1 Tax=Microlunatus elymi TaxID=2596828 RepID=A0A516Q439_9ACTN|nr:carbohydrate ABC transporter permease [Microlunatus elymi]QDP98178.1 carbohydrate ABC transporter permease [Microlunatus elymi]
MAAISGVERDTPTKQVLYAVGGILTLIIIVVPLLWALLRSMQPSDVISAPPDPNTFFDLTFSNFAKLFSESNLGRSVLNSLIVSLGAAVLCSALALFAGYGFAKFRFRISPVLFAAILLSMMVPFQAILTPLYLQLNAMGLTNNLLGLILFYATVNLPFGVFVMRNSFSGLPSELEDSSHVDGAGPLRTLFSVLWPLVVPGVATTALYAFLVSWTEFLGALVFITNPDRFTLPVNLVNLQQGAYGQVDYGLLAAGAVVAMIPCVILYAALQRFYVRGLASGAVKG